MINKTTKLTAAALLGALASMAANSAPVLNPANGHLYEVIPASAISWADAKTAADSASFTVDGVEVPVHLATLTSAEEDAFVDQLREDSGLGQVWIGGSQATTATELGDGWQWENMEGEIPGVDTVTPYANWGDNDNPPDVEPNDGDDSENGTENHLALGRYGLGRGWNDEGAAPQLIEGYVIESANTVDAGTCVAGVGEGSCNPSGVLPTSLPAGTTPPGGGTVTQALVKFEPDLDDVCQGDFVRQDPRVLVDAMTGEFAGIMDMDSLVLSDLFVTPPPMGEELILDEYTYGSPCLAVVKGGANFDLTPTLANGGVVDSEQIPEDVPNIGPVFGCDSPDLQRRTQFGYSTTITSLMHEGTGAAMTHSCNSPSRSGTFRFSYFIFNTHEDCGIDINLAGGPQAVVQCFTDLAVAKYDLLEEVLFDSRPTLIKGKFTALTSKLNQARSMTKTGQYGKSNIRLEALLGRIKAAEWDVINNDLNYPGNMEMRILNLIHRNNELNDVN